MDDLLEQMPEEAKERLSEKSPLGWTEPMLARLTDKRFSDPDWIYERKLDGERVLAYCRRGKITLYSRNEKELNATYPEVAEALEKMARERDFIIDGEVVCFSGDVTDFKRLQERMQIKDSEEARKSNVAVYYYVFDVVYYEGFDLSKVPLRHRKGVLREAFDYEDPIRFMAHRNEEGEKFHQRACEKGWEGVIAKDANSQYVHGRSSKWLKMKCAKGQELVIGGFTDPQGERIGFGALLVGFYENGDLRYAGKVGTGYDDETLKELGDRLKSMERKTSPFADEVKEKGAHFVTPKLIGEFGFTEWTGDNKLRHPRFLGLRRDKEPEEVHKETPKS